MPIIHDIKMSCSLRINMNILLSRLINTGVILITLLFSVNTWAAKWIDVGDLHLRSNIQLLADAGLITVPVNTYPLMWSGVISDLNKHQNDPLEGVVKQSFEQVMQAYQRSHGKSRTQITASAANEPSRFQHFEDSPRNKGQITLSHEGETEHFSYKLSANVQSADNYGDSVASLDNSYISGFLGNWALTLGSYQQWHGPGWDADLIRSNNARPMPSVFITRNKSEEIDFPILRWLGPWAFTTGVSWMNDERAVDNTLLWSMRLTFKPIHNLEIGVSRASQLCGNGRPCGAETWKNMFIGKDNAGRDGLTAEQEPGNGLAAVDARWGDVAFDIPYGIYWQSMGEDAVRLDRFPPFQAKSYLYGADISYQAFGQYIRTYVEYSDSQPTCSGIDGNCAYEHHTYQSGYRYNQRSVGSTYDNDARTYTLGFVGNNESEHQWQMNFRYLELNRDNSNRSGYGGNRVTDIAEDASQLEGIYQWPIFIGSMKVGLVYTYSTFENDIDAKSDIDAWMKWNYEF